MKKNTGAWLTSILLMFAGTVFAAENPLTIIEKSETVFRFRATFPVPQVTTIMRDQQEMSTLSVPDYPEFVCNGKHRLPYYPVLINMNGQGARVTIESVKQRTISVPALLPFHGDMPKGTDQPTSANIPVFVPDNAVELRQVGSLSGNPLWSVDIYPYISQPDGRTVTVITELIARIDFAANTGNAVKTKSDTEQLERLGVVAQSMRKSKAPRTLFRTVAEPQEQWKILVDQEGLYHVTGEQLSEAGIDLNAVDIKNLRLTLDGKDVAIFVGGWKDGDFDVDDYIEFWGKINRYPRTNDSHDIYADPFTSTNVYWLSWGSKGKWMGEEDAQVSLATNTQYVSPISFLDTVHVEQNNYFERFNTITYDAERDHWFYDSGIRSGLKKDYTFELHSPDVQSTQNLQCRVFMSGRTASDTLAHSAKVYINNTYMYDYSWWGQNMVDMKLDENVTLSGVDLEHGANTLSILNTNLSGDFDYILFNWMDMIYPRLYRAFDNQLKFSVPDDFSPNTYLFRLDGFTSNQVSVYKIGQNKMLGARVTESVNEQDETVYKVSFQDFVTSASVQYVAVTPEAKLTPLDIVADEPTQLTAPQVSAEYVLITHPRFKDMEVLDELLSLRQSQGYQTLKVNVQDIYDEFNFGKPSDQAIKDFLSYAWANWTDHPLKYVLLVGDGSYVRYTHDVEPDTLDLIPVHMRQTIDFGAAASDYWYTLLDGGDEIPEIYLGRLPAREPEQVEFAVQKIINYETTPPSGNWRNRVLYIGGNDLIFRNQGLYLSSVAPGEYDTNLLFTYRDANMNPDPYFGGTLDLLDYFNQGCSVISFHGHGGGAIWADNGLLRIEDAEQIYSQGKLPTIFSMTCFTGSFESPSRESLADALLFTENEGVIAMLGASGYGWTYNDYWLERELMQYMYENPRQTLGEIINSGKIRYYLKYASTYVHPLTEINQYHILGDPATRLHFPDTVVPVVPDKQVVQQGDVVSFTSEVPFTSGTGRFDLLDSLKLIVDHRNVVVNNGTVSSQFTIGPDVTTKTASVRMYASDAMGTRQAHGAFNLTLGGVLFDSTVVTLSASDSVCFYVRMLSGETLNSVKCLSRSDTLTMHSIGNDWYQSSRCLPLNNFNGELYYVFLAETNTGQEYKSQSFVYHVKKGPDLLPDYSSMKIAGQQQVEFNARVFNYGDMDANRVPVQLSFQENGSWTVNGYDTVNVQAFSYADVTIPLAMPPGEFLFKLHIDPDTLYREAVIANNSYQFNLEIDRFNFIPGSGLSFGTTVLDTLHWDDHFSLHIPDDMFTQNQVVGITRHEEIEIIDQPDFQVIANQTAFSIEFPGIIDNTSVPAQASISLDDTTAALLDSLGYDFDMYGLSRVSQKWVKLNGTRSGQTITASIYASSKVALLTTQDTQVPSVQVSIDGQPYARDKYVSPDPQFTLVLQDANGLDVESIRVLLNGAEQQRQDLAIPDTVLNTNHVVAKLAPDLATGDHTLQVQCQDCNGNLYTSEELTFRTSGEFNIRMLGNYPNPFKDQTLFAYMFTIPVDKVDLKIYTASGRMIRDLDPFQFSEDPNPLAADYHEVLWDALDMHGNEIANGVYFYKLSVTANGETKKITGKMAKLY